MLPARIKSMRCTYPLGGHSLSIDGELWCGYSRCQSMIGRVSTNCGNDLARAPDGEVVAVFAPLDPWILWIAPSFIEVTPGHWQYGRRALERYRSQATEPRGGGLRLTRRPKMAALPDRRVRFERDHFGTAIVGTETGRRSHPDRKSWTDRCPRTDGVEERYVDLLQDVVVTCPRCGCETAIQLDGLDAAATHRYERCLDAVAKRDVERRLLSMSADQPARSAGPRMPRRYLPGLGTIE
jgi:hypothetical protein